MPEGERTVAVYRNPKDSLNGKRSLQHLPLDGSSALVFPIHKDKILGEKLVQLGKQFQENPSLPALDSLLKEVHAAYLMQGKTPDMYNSDMEHFDKMTLHQGDDQVGMYNKKTHDQHGHPIEISLIRIKAPGREIAFTGRTPFVKSGLQYGAEQIVLVHDTTREPSEFRKMAPDYAEENFVFSRGQYAGQPVTLDKLPTFEYGSPEVSGKLEAGKTQASKIR